MTTDVQRRARVYRLLTDGASYKIQRAGTDAALGFIRDAYELASKEPRLDVWAALAAYRLAHLLLRGSPTQKQLEEIDELFTEAARQPALGPYPRIYRLAVLQRLGVKRPLIETTFREALNAYEEWTRKHATTDTAGITVTPNLQTDLFALLDLAGYFLAIDRGPLEGRGARVEDPLRDAQWRIVGPDPALADVLVSEAFARAELDPLASKLSASCTFVLPPSRDGATIRALGGEPKPLPHRAARLLAVLLRGHAHDHRALVERVMGGDGESYVTAFRQVKRRLVTQLQGLGVTPPAELVVETTGAAPRLAPALVVVGAVSESGYDDRER